MRSAKTLQTGHFVRYCGIFEVPHNEHKKVTQKAPFVAPFMP